MNPLGLPGVVHGGPALAAVALSLVALWRARVLFRAASERAKAGQAQSEAALRALRESLNALAAQLREVQEQPALMVAPAVPKPGLNLSKRSQALRMHRRGDSPEQIAAALDVPVQEVELLLKVHRIVIGSL